MNPHFAEHAAQGPIQRCAKEIPGRPEIHKAVDHHRAGGPQQSVHRLEGLPTHQVHRGRIPEECVEDDRVITIGRLVKKIPGVRELELPE